MNDGFNNNTILNILQVLRYLSHICCLNKRCTESKQHAYSSLLSSVLTVFSYLVRMVFQLFICYIARACTQYNAYKSYAGHNENKSLARI